MSQLMLVWSARRPTTQTQRKAMDVVSKVVLEAIHR
jgi:LysR family nitrogen assimilation transcriptional regulator